MKVLLASLIALASSFETANLAAADTSAPPASVGYDIGFPQCTSNLPIAPGFGIVGVNDGRPFTLNPCLVEELQWAQSTLTSSAEFYANTANPGPTGNSSWPTFQQTPQICFGANSIACAYDYGWNAAQGSFQNAVTAETQSGSTSPSAAATSAHWWLDVESGNAWETIRTNSAPTSASFANDEAVIQGELAYFASIGVAPPGIYSTESQWKGLIGDTGSAFASTKVWMTGAATLSGAQAECTSTSFTGGRVALIQYPSNGLDGDYQCPLLSGPVSSAVSVASSATFTDQLAVAGESAPVSYVQTTGSPSLSVSSSGLVTTNGPLATGTYTATGTSSANGDVGTFTFTLLVGSLTQTPPTTASASVAATDTFTDQLAVTGASGTLTYVQSAGAPALIVSPTGLITTSGALATGSYVVRGNVSDAAGDKGTFFFNLKVGSISQSHPLRATTSAPTSATFTDQLAVTGASGTPTYVQSAGAPALVVSPTGLITTSGALATGSYVARGIVSDAAGDKGTFFFNLLVGATAPTTTTTTTTTPPVVRPVAYRVIGHVVAGKTVTIKVAGLGFFGRPLVLAHTGTTAFVTKDSGKMLTVRVTVRRRSRNGIFTFVITLANGKLCSVRYVQR